jgi:hypothetical protein
MEIEDNVKVIISFLFAVMSHKQLVLDIQEPGGGSLLIVAIDPDMLGLVGAFELWELHRGAPTSVTTAVHLPAAGGACTGVVVVGVVVVSVVVVGCGVEVVIAGVVDVVVGTGDVVVVVGTGVVDVVVGSSVHSIRTGVSILLQAADTPDPAVLSSE